MKKTDEVEEVEAKAAVKEAEAVVEAKAAVKEAEAVVEAKAAVKEAETVEKKLLVNDNSELLEKLDENLEKMKSIVSKMPEKKGDIFIDWIKTRADYLGKEVDFKPSSLRAYSRGEVILVTLGFNVGSEFGGEHFGVVVSDSKKNNPGINIIPLTSYKDEFEGVDLSGLTEEDIEKSINNNSVYLGNLPGINEKLSIALVNQMQYISKIRVKSPKSAKQKVEKISDEQLNKLDDKIRKMYTKLKS